MAGVLLVAHVVSALCVFPNYIAYANEAWGGPKNLHNLLSDANVDWGQQLYQVKQWQDRHPGEECWFAYFARPGDPSRRPMEFTATACRPSTPSGWAART